MQLLCRTIYDAGFDLVEEKALIGHMTNIKQAFKLTK